VHEQPCADEKASTTTEKQDSGDPIDVFAEDEAHQIQYKTLSWPVRLSKIVRSEIMIKAVGQPAHDIGNR